MIVAYDVTEMRRLETMRRDFVANVSHELRTPVSVIRANAETLLDEALEEEKLRGFSFKQFSEILNGSLTSLQTCLTCLELRPVIMKCSNRD